MPVGSTNGKPGSQDAQSEQRDQGEVEWAGRRPGGDDHRLELRKVPIAALGPSAARPGIVTGHHRDVPPGWPDPTSADRSGHLTVDLQWNRADDHAWKIT
jgi:hypothetical protein